MSRPTSHDVDHSRHYPNPYEDYSPQNAEAYIDPATNQLTEKCKEMLKESTKRTADYILKSEQFWTVEDDYSMYTGSAGIAYSFYQYGKYSSDPFYTNKALELLQRCMGKLRGKGRVAFLTGTSGPLTLYAIICQSNGKTEEAKSMISKLKSMGPLVLHESSEMPDELLYGRSGYLYCLLYLNKHVSPPPVEPELIKQVVSLIIKSGNVYAFARKCQSPLMYAWHDSEYLGGAHGLAGILYLLLQARQYLTPSQLQNDIKPALQYLQSLRYPSGNFPSSIGSKTDRLVHWCHGAPGNTMLYCLAYEVFKEDQFMDTALQCGEVVWTRGILKKGCGICHGTCGNAYTFLSLYQQTKDAKHLYRACKFAEYFAEHGEHQSKTAHRPFSLMEGIAGSLHFMIDMQSPLTAKFPAYTI